MADQSENAKLKKMTQLLFLERLVRQKSLHQNEIGFHVVNDTLRLCDYRQCFLWEVKGDKVSVTHASGVSHVDADSPFLMWFNGLLAQKIGAYNAPQGDTGAWTTLHHIKKSDCSDEDAAAWQNWLYDSGLLIVFWSPAGTPFAGMWLDREKTFEQSEETILAQAADAYAHALYMAQQAQHEKWSQKLKRAVWDARWKKIALVAFIVVALFPVRQSVTAPAEIIPKDPYMISAPLDAVIDEVHIDPNQSVKTGEILISFDATELQNKIAITQKEIQVLRTELSQTARQAFTEGKSKGRIAVINAEIDAKKVELAYLQDRMKRMQVTAPFDGQVIFTDPSELRGQPVKTGQRIMLLAKPDNSQLLVRVPVDNMIRPDRDVAVRAFLNVAPLTEYRADIRFASYQPAADADGLMTYKLKADFAEGVERPVIGLQGAAKVYGDYTILSYQLLRRPLGWIRKTLGF